MPLLRCPDCGKDLSDKAPACIHCGRPNIPAKAPPPTPPKRLAPLSALLGLGAAALLAGLILLVLGKPTYTPQALGAGIVLVCLGGVLGWVKR